MSDKNSIKRSVDYGASVLMSSTSLFQYEMSLNEVSCFQHEMSLKR
jgi:hypothetical protein